MSFEIFLSSDPSSKECPNTNFYLFHPHNVHMFWALFSFWVLRFTFAMILLYRKIQMLFSVTAATTKFTCCAVSSFWVLRLYTFIWSFIKGTFNYYFLSLLLPQSLHSVLSNISEFWDYTLPHDPSSKEHSYSTFFYCFNHKVNMLFAVFIFLVLRFTFHMILHQRNVQILISIFFTA